MKQAYLEPSWEAGRDLVARGIAGEVVMLNLRLRAVADYAASPGCHRRNAGTGCVKRHCHDTDPKA